MPKRLITDYLHPDYRDMIPDWLKFRRVMEGGRRFRDYYLTRFSALEDANDFEQRREMTPIPAHAKSAVLEVKNAIFQRMVDISRQGGTNTYRKAIKGENGGVDLQSTSMNDFIGGERVLQELLSMKRVAIYIDRPNFDEGQITLAQQEELAPYMYTYNAECILNWKFDSNNQLISVLLKDTVFEDDPIFGLPTSTINEYRLLQMVRDEETGRQMVRVIFLNEKAEPKQEPVFLNLTRIPVVILELSQSVLKDIADYQIALLNMESSDINYALKSNFPFYVEQYQPNASDFLRPASEEATGTAANIARTEKIKVGATKGRAYPKGLEAPGFIHPSSEPLKVSMEKQTNMKADIRQLMHLAITNLKPVRQSAESKEKDLSGLEAGLSAVGMELERAEREIASIWSLYERQDTQTSISYPTNYSLKSEADRTAEADKKIELLPKIPSLTYQKEVAKEVVKLTVAHKISAEELQIMMNEIQSAKVVSIDPDVIEQDHQAGFVSTKTASRARLYPEGEVEQAKIDHADRLARIAIAQSSELNGARGIKDAEITGEDSEAERRASQTPDLSDTAEDGRRGEGQ